MTTTLSRPATRSTSAGPLLLAGAVSGPLFVAVVLAQAATREGYDPARHPLSALALGEFGWLQVANFIVCGGLAIAGAVGLRRALPPGRGSTWIPRLIGLGGAALIVAGVFRTDPINGFPVGAQDAVSWHGIVHSSAPTVSGIAGLIVYLLFALRFAAARESGWLVWTILTPVAVVATNVLALAAADFRPMVLGELIGGTWATTVYLKVRRQLNG